MYHSDHVLDNGYCQTCNKQIYDPEVLKDRTLKHPDKCDSCNTILKGMYSIFWNKQEDRLQICKECFNFSKPTEAMSQKFSEGNGYLQDCEKRKRDKQKRKDKQ